MYLFLTIIGEGYYENFKCASLVDLVYNSGLEIGKLKVELYFEKFKDVLLVVLAYNWLSLATTHQQEVIGNL